MSRTEITKDVKNKLVLNIFTNEIILNGENVTDKVAGMLIYYMKENGYKTIETEDGKLTLTVKTN